MTLRATLSERTVISTGGWDECFGSRPGGSDGRVVVRLGPGPSSGWTTYLAVTFFEYADAGDPPLAL